VSTHSNLAAGLAHEIRNPLNGASLHLSVLERELARSPGVSRQAHEALAVVRAELRRLSAFITDFLEVARPPPVVLAPVDVNDVVRDAVEQLGRAAAERAVELRVDLPAGPVVVSADGERLKRAVLNLLVNALEAVEPHGRVVGRVQTTDDHVEIEVEDDGPGVTPGDPPIFDAFYTTKPVGTGLGLSVVSRAADDHGGDVSYRSVPGCTVFRIRLPRADASTGLRRDRGPRSAAPSPSEPELPGRPSGSPR
jgi:signal transduction histidine kinase